MTTYSGYGSSSMPIVPMFFVMVAISLVALAFLGGAGTVANAPRPTRDPETGINFDDALAEAKSLLTDLKPGGNAPLARSTSGLIRVGYSRGGEVCVEVGSSGYPALDALAERILAALVY